MSALPLIILMLSFQSAFERLLSRAPGPVFPRARQLYLKKYFLEGHEPAPFRTFLLEEEIQESPGGAIRVRGLAFAVVHWQGGQTGVDTYADYLWERWRLEPDDLTPVDGEPWFRGNGAYARFSAPAVFERATPTALVSSSADPADPEDDSAPSG